MKCNLCEGFGLILICYRQDRTYDVAACTCAKGGFWRTREQLKAWADRQNPKPSRIGGLEDFYSARALEELRTATDLDQDVGGIPTFVGEEAKA